jgi:hypothetical protein
MISAKLCADIKDANSNYEDNVEPNVIEQYRIYYAEKEFYEKMFPVLSKTSSLTSTDVFDTMEWTLPALMKMFTASEDIITLQGVTVEDDKPAETMQKLINYQLTKKNPIFQILYTWFKDALITNLGIVKCYWDREEKVVKQQQQIALSEDALAQFQQQYGDKMKIIEAVPDLATGIITVTFEAPKIIKNQPVIENILASEFRYSSDANNLDNADFVAHRKIVSIDYLRKKAKEGLYDKQAVKEVADKAKEPDYTTLDYENNPHLDERKQQTDRGRVKTEIYECYVKMALKDDPEEELENYIITMCQDIILRIEPNHYGRHPFFAISPSIDPHQVYPKHGFVDSVAPLQHLKTAMIKQLAHNVAISNNPQLAINANMLVDINDVLESRQLIRTNGAINEAIQAVARPQLQPWTFNMLEYIDQQRASRTGITPYNQGVDSNSMNKTATGVNLIQQAANQRIELIGRMFNETGLIPLFRFLVELNQKFIDEETVIRLTNEQLTIRPDDLNGDFDLIANGGMGASSKETEMAQVQNLSALIEKLMPTGLVGVDQIYNAGKKAIETMGFKNVDDYIMTPDKIQQQPPESPKATETIRMDFASLPANAKSQLANMLGLQTTPEDFIQQMQLEQDIKSQAEGQKIIGQGAVNVFEDMLKGVNNGQGTQTNGTGAGNQASGTMQGNQAVPPQMGM